MKIVMLIYAQKRHKYAAGIEESIFNSLLGHQASVSTFTAFPLLPWVIRWPATGEEVNN